MNPLLFSYLAQMDCAADKAERLFGVIPKWYKYLPYENNPVSGRCEVVVNFSDGFNELLPIGLALIEIGLAIAGFVTVIFIIYGGFQYLTSQGEPEQAKKALHTIANAFIGAVITIVASVFVAFLGNRLG